MQDADYRRLVEDSPLATVVVERATGDGAAGWRATWLNRAAADLFAVTTVPRPVDVLVHPGDLPGVLAALARGAGGDRTAHEWRFLSGDGGTVAVEVLIGAVGRDALALSCWDVTRHVERARDLTHRATHDRLTGLPNRGLLEDRWELARSRARRSGDAPVVAFCDVDDLKLLNDEHGHLVGDRALVRIAERLAAVSRSGDTVARFGGDEFVVLVDTSAEVDPQALEQRLREAVSRVPVDLPDGSGVSVRCSVGLVTDDLSESPAEVLARADRHMYEDKRRHRS